MKILCLYNNDCAVPLFEWIYQQGHKIIMKTDRLMPEWCEGQGFDLTLSYTYRYILEKSVLDTLGHNVVNLHNSYLPWNRGADPNIWSILDETPRGVTLHYVDERLDKGSIIAQRFVLLGEKETLRSSYDALDAAAQELFKEAFYYYSFWPSMRKKAEGRGTYHSKNDDKMFKSHIDSYGITVEEFKKKYGGGIT